jgi:hypothetical protein
MIIKQKSAAFNFFRSGKLRMKKSHGPVEMVKIGLAVTMLTVFTGCVGFVGDGGYYDGGVVVAEPDVFLFGGGYDRGRDVHGYSNRGAESRAAAHGGGGHGGGGRH